MNRPTPIAQPAALIPIACQPPVKNEKTSARPAAQTSVRSECGGVREIHHGTGTRRDKRQEWQKIHRHPGSMATGLAR